MFSLNIMEVFHKLVFLNTDLLSGLNKSTKFWDIWFPVFSDMRTVQSRNEKRLIMWVISVEATRSVLCNQSEKYCIVISAMNGKKKENFITYWENLKWILSSFPGCALKQKDISV